MWEILVKGKRHHTTFSGGNWMQVQKEIDSIKAEYPELEEKDIEVRMMGGAEQI